MSNLEHYFENLLYYGEDVYGGINKQSLTPDVQDAVEVCAQYVIYSLFGNRKAFEKFINEGSNDVDVPWEKLERYAEFFCADVPYTEFVREAKLFCLDAERSEE